MQQKNIVKILPSPFKKSTVKIERETFSTKDRKVQFRQTKDGVMKPIKKFVEEKNLQRLPGTKVTYKQAVTRNGLNTGLDKIVANPYKDLNYYRDDWEKVLKGVDRIKLQHVLEYKHSKDIDWYGSKNFNNRTTNLAHSQGKELKFFQLTDSHINLNEGVTILDLDIPRDEVLYYSCLVHGKIANSYENLEFKPGATHYIVREEEELKRDSNKRRKFNKAGGELERIYELADNTIQEFCKVLNISRKNMTKDIAYELLEKYYRENNDSYEEFIYFIELWDDVATRPKFKAHAKLHDFVHTPEMISVRNGKYYWNQPDPETGKRTPWTWESKDKVIEWLLAPEYQNEVEALEAQYKAKRIELEV